MLGPLCELFQALFLIKQTQVVLSIGEEHELAIAIPGEATSFRVSEEASLASAFLGAREHTWAHLLVVKAD